MIKRRRDAGRAFCFLGFVRNIFPVDRICQKEGRRWIRFVSSINTQSKKNKDMKKIIASLALTLLVFTGSIFAGTGDVPQSVNGAFNEKFAQAKDVKWETGKGFYKAEFEMRGRTLMVYFAGNGDIMGIAGNLSPVKLPESLRSEIKKNYAGYWITDLFKYRNTDENGFVVTLEGADKVIVLKATGGQGWLVYRTAGKD